MLPTKATLPPLCLDARGNDLGTDLIEPLKIQLWDDIFSSPPEMNLALIGGVLPRADNRRWDPGRSGRRRPLRPEGSLSLPLLEAGHGRCLRGWPALKR
jgi:hypothetical protein